jgi:nicotinamidase/pyrazinamidase
MSYYDSTTALIVVDVQNDFADSSGSLYVTEGEQVVPFANSQIKIALAAGAGVYYTQDWHPPSTPHFKKDGGIWPVHCVADTWGAQLHPDLDVQGPIVRKGTEGEDGYSGFSMRHHETGETLKTELEARLKADGVGRLVIVGLATDYCVKATAVDARARDYPTTVLVDGIRAVDLASGDGERAIAELRLAGVQVADEDQVESIGGAADARRSADH